MTGPPPADSAGVPWGGRVLTSTGFDDDRGEADERLVELLDQRTRIPSADADRELLAALRSARVIVPVVATAAGTDESGAHRVETSTEMAVVTLTAPDGRRALPVFTGVEALAAWDPTARPVPTPAARAAQAAVAEGCDVMVVDLASGHPSELRPSMVWALAQEQQWLPPHQDPFVAGAVGAAVLDVPDVVGHRVEEGTPHGSGTLLVVLRLRPGLDEQAVREVATEVAERLAHDGELRARVDGLAFAVQPA